MNNHGQPRRNSVSLVIQTGHKRDGNTGMTVEICAVENCDEPIDPYRAEVLDRRASNQRTCWYCPVSPSADLSLNQLMNR